MSKTVRTLLMGLFTACLLNAGLIYNNGLPNGIGGSEMSQWNEAASFTLGSAASLTNVRFWDVQGSYYGSIHWQIYTDGGGLPGSLLYSGDATPTQVVDTSARCCSLTGYRDDFSVGSLALSGGVTYWLALHNGPLSHDSLDRVYWASTGTSPYGSASYDLTSDGVWVGQTYAKAFELFGDSGSSAPEPDTIALTTLGIGAVLLLRAKPRKTA